MFEEEDEGQFRAQLVQDMNKFEAYLEGEYSTIFFDSERWEIILDQYVLQGKYTKALKCASVALDQFPFNKTLQIRKAQAFSAMGKLKDALTILNALEGLDESDYYELYLSKASVFSQLRDSKQAIRYFKLALEYANEEDKDEVYLDLAMEYEALEDFEGALKVLKEAVAYNPENEGAHYEIAFCYDVLGDFDKSIECYTQFIDENPYSFTAWYNLGNAHMKMENYDKAIWAYDYSILINESFGAVFYNLGHAKMEIEKYSEAVEAFQKAIEIDGDDPVIYCYIGECYEQLNDLIIAKEYYRRSLDLSPYLADAWLGLGIIADLEGQTLEAIELIKKAIELDPENSGIYHVLAGAYEKLDDFDLASENYEKSLELDINDEDCLKNYVELLTKEGFVSTFEFLKEFDEKDHKNAILPILVVNILWQMGEKINALESFKQCVANDIQNARKLFDVNPSLLSVPEFVLLAE